MPDKVEEWEKKVRSTPLTNFPFILGSINQDYFLQKAIQAIRYEWSHNPQVRYWFANVLNARSLGTPISINIRIQDPIVAI